MYIIDSAVLVAMLVLNVIVNIITLAVLILTAVRKSSPWSSSEDPVPKAQNRQLQYRAPSEDSGIVFCRNCDCKFDALHEVCPNCKTPHDQKL